MAGTTRIADRRGLPEPGSVNSQKVHTASLQLNRLTRRFGETLAVDSVSLEVAAGEFLTLLGPSGCGKTTTLRMIAGFEQPTSGRVVVGDRDVTGLPPQRRDVGMVFQNYALFPHLDVWENVAFGLKSRGDRRDGVAPQVKRALELVEMGGYGRRKVQELSGGQQQRVALARALAPEPPLLLLDEPLSNLDAALRERTRDELRALLKRLGMTAVFVTHDQEEAFALSDRVAVLNLGRLQQLGTPQELYGAPANAFVAAFLGRANFFAATVDSVDGDGAVCRLST
ncbi:MAG: ABC transporter ATP-binding protein, partial [Gemmatimonadetes bacterium]|nr:ABC transporter ATP-binding protein [Gemmatimonadota bacterium]